MAIGSLEKISEMAYKWHYDTPPLKFLLGKENNDLGGTLAHILDDQKISRIQYEIIKLKIFNKMMEAKK